MLSQDKHEYLKEKHIVTCRRGGVSNKPPRATGSDKTRDQGSFVPFTGGLNLDKANLIRLPKILKRRTDRTLDPFYLDRINLARHNILYY